MESNNRYNLRKRNKENKSSEALQNPKENINMVPQTGYNKFPNDSFNKNDNQESSNKLQETHTSSSFIGTRRDSRTSNTREPPDRKKSTSESGSLVRGYSNEVCIESSANILEASDDFSSQNIENKTNLILQEDINKENDEKESLLPNSNNNNNNNIKYREGRRRSSDVSKKRRDSGLSLVSHCSDHPEDESALTIAKQVVVPYIMAAIGLVGAGLFLDKIQHWNVYQEINELYVLVPSLLGLKGNLEMTLASRMSTAANKGELDDIKERNLIIKGNLALIQCQASVVALFAAIIAMTLSWIPLGTFNMYHALILCSASLYTAALASVILSSIMMFIIIKCHKYGINPDNVATPIAASLGDLTTLALLSGISHFLFIAKDSSYHWIIPLALFVFILLIPVWVSIASEIKQTNDTLKNGWEPVIAAMFISSTGGFILEKAINIFNGIAIYTPGMNGVGGNLAAIQASRISTYLHRKILKGDLQDLVNINHLI